MKISIHTILDVFSQVMDTDHVEDGLISRVTFKKAMRQLTRRNRMDIKNKKKTEKIVDDLFQAILLSPKLREIRRGPDNKIDFIQIVLALSILCSGDRVEKMKVIFSLYDVNDLGYISLYNLEEYLTVIFMVLFTFESNIRNKMGIDYEELSSITANKVFLKKSNDQLTFEELHKWTQMGANG